jgi:hypothetical protein
MTEHLVDTFKIIYIFKISLIFLIVLVPECDICLISGRCKRIGILFTVSGIQVFTAKLRVRPVGHVVIS